MKREVIDKMLPLLGGVLLIFGLTTRPIEGQYEPAEVGIGSLSEGGPVGPDGKTEVACDLPIELRMKNVGGRDGAGLCVFTSINHSANWQNESRLFDLQKKMRSEAGGGWPEKVDKMLAKYGNGTEYLNAETKDPAILVAALQSGRMPAVTYNGQDQHYRGQKVAHMVNLVCYDEQANLAAVLDNNFIGENQLVWMSCKEFCDRWTGGRQGWVVVLLNPGPGQPPRN